MTKGALAVLIRGGSDNWAAERWVERFGAELPGRTVVPVPEVAHDPAAIRYAAVWKPAPGELRAFPNLQVIFNLGAGVDALMADRELPDVPIVRVADDNLTRRMTEYVVMHALMHHRQQAYLADCQKRHVWAPRLQAPASAVRVGILGFGTLGRHAAEVLKAIGFQVAGWSRSARQAEGIELYSGADGLDAFLARTDMLVCLLPLTPETQGILSRSLFAKLAKDGPLGGPVLINAGRGGLQVEADILACLDDGTLHAASLDVFTQEPLPQDSPFWDHPRVTLSPHNAADTDADAIAAYVARQIAAFEAGKALDNVVDRTRGY